MNVYHRARLLLFGILSMALTAAGQLSTPVPYSISTFATGVAHVYFQPDSIALLDGRIFIGYRNGGAPDGSDGKSSTIVEYKKNGDVVKIHSVVGKQRWVAGESTHETVVGFAE
jgi:hypothetical protein